MKKILLAPFLCFASTSIVVSQNYHQPGDILKILTDSRVSYEIGNLEAADMKIVEYPAQIEHGLFLKNNADGSLSVSKYDQEFSHIKDYAENLSIAEKAFTDDKFAQARESYLKVLAVAPSNSQVMTFVGQTYANERNDSLAGSWYEKAIKSNYFDYMAHWFLADVYEKAGQKQKAVAEILVAKILNRNNPRLSDALERILKSSELTYANWEFAPRCEVKHLGGNKASIKYDQNHSEWLPYALCKALWQFEPGYRESMLKGANEHPTIIEEKECIVNLLIGLQNSKQETNDRALQVAQKALDQKMFTQYLVYEIILPRNPRFAFNLSQGLFDTISAYVLKFRPQ